MQTEPLFDVVIFNRETREVDTIIGSNMRRWDGEGSGRNTAELRQQTGEEKVNEHYGVKIVEAGKFKKGDKLPIPQSPEFD
jgi:hypothetical protein